MSKPHTSLPGPSLVALALLALGGCQGTGAPTGLAGSRESATPKVIELDRQQWKIGDLDAETVFLLEEGIPHHLTTVTNNNPTDRWWTGLKVYGYKIFGKTPPVITEPISDEEWDQLTEEEMALRISGGWGGFGGQACRSSSSLPEIAKGAVRMGPGETRSYRDAHPKYPDSPKREHVTGWGLSGKAALPSESPFHVWPPFQLNLEFSWDDEAGCSVEAEALDL